MIFRVNRRRKLCIQQDRLRRASRNIEISAVRAPVIPTSQYFEVDIRMNQDRHGNAVLDSSLEFPLVYSFDSFLVETQPKRMRYADIMDCCILIYAKRDADRAFEPRFNGLIGIIGYCLFYQSRSCHSGISVPVNVLRRKACDENKA